MPASPRLFVPLSTDPYRWFESGEKRYELRRSKGSYARSALPAGRPVELRRGYSTPDSILGQIGRVVSAETIEGIYEQVRYSEITPIATSKKNAVAIAKSILGPKPGPFVAFEVIVD